MGGDVDAVALVEVVSTLAFVVPPITELAFVWVAVLHGPGKVGVPHAANRLIGAGVRGGSGLRGWNRMIM